jgi:hypothetical protein
MGNSAKYWDCNVSNKTKIAVAKALGSELDRQTEIDLKMAIVGIDQRREEAKRKCAERHAKRDALKSQNTQ